MMLTASDWLNVFVAVVCAGYASYLANEVGSAVRSILHDYE
jgi:hypothetical protein